MKKSLFFLISFLMMGMALFAQTSIALTFNGQDQNNARVQLDNVVIQNVTRGWTETIFFPDTVYTLTVGTGVADYLLHSGMQVMPNPFDGRTQVNIHSVKRESVTMTLMDINGKRCAEYKGLLSEGNNYFEIELVAPQTYILSVQTAEGTRSLKMVNTGGAGRNQIKETGVNGNAVQLKSTKAHNFELGDEMRYTGYSQQSNGLIPSTPITQNQYESEVITLHFTLSENPCLGTPTVTDYDGNIYNTVQIGTQCWMKENLRTTKYADGTSIALGSTTSETTAYRYYPDNNSSNVSTYGYLYNWPAVMHGASSSVANPSGVQGICPTGWHVPSDAEWTQLTDYVSSQSQYVCGNDNTYIAKALASTTGWNTSSNTCAVGNNQSSNNVTGFSAFPAGYYSGSYNDFGYNAYYWSSTEYNSSAAWDRCLRYGYASVSRSKYKKDYGFSVRCVRD